MVMMGYTPLSLNMAIPQGLDGVFEHDGQRPGRNVPKTVVFDPVSSTPPPIRNMWSLKPSTIRIQHQANREKVNLRKRNRVDRVLGNTSMGHA